MLFQPTNITPSSFAGAGGDLVLAGQDMDVTWQVNGPSPMTAYQIVIYSNDSTSTQMFSTGRVALSSPFYGVDGMGDVRLFTVSIDSSDLSGAGIVAGNENGYKYKITQWWSADDYVVQSAENYFIIQNEPAVTIDTTTITSPSASITGTWAQAEGVGMDWVRWVITLADPETNLSTGEVVIDSGKIHTQTLAFSYDGWISGTKYAVQLLYQLQNGYSGSVSTIVSATWTQAEARATATAMLTDGCANAIISYPIPTYAEITATPTAASISDGVLNITSASETLEWNGGVMTGAPVYGGLVWCGIPNGKVTMTAAGAFTTADGGFYRDNTLEISLTPGTGTLTWTAHGDDEDETGEFSFGGDVTGKLVTILCGCGGTWYGAVQTGSATEVFRFESPLKTGLTLFADSAALTLGGLQACRYFGFISLAATEETLAEIADGNGEQPEFTPDWLFLSDWAEDGYRVLGVMPENTAPGTPQTNSIIVYRRENGAPVMKKLYAMTDQTDMQTTNIGRIIDYGAVSGKQYTYSVYYAYDDGNGGTSFALMVRTGSVIPCYWDWILTTAQRNEDGTYRATGSYRFGLNLETGAMSNNNAPALMTNFTRYPTRQGVSANYRSGSLTAFIGSVDTAENTYVDTAEQADAILALGASTDTKFLRSRKGELWMVDTAAATTVQVGDKYKEQPYTATLSWVETGSAEGVSIISVPTDEAWKDKEGTPGSSGTSDIITTPLTVTANGTYTAPNGFAYTPVTVQIPYAAGGSF